VCGVHDAAGDPRFERPRTAIGATAPDRAREAFLHGVKCRLAVTRPREREPKEVGAATPVHRLDLVE